MFLRDTWNLKPLTNNEGALTETMLSKSSLYSIKNLKSGREIPDFKMLGILYHW